MDLNIPPYDQVAEQAILGCILMNKDALNEAMERLEEKDFYRDDHKKIFDAISKLYIEGSPVDILTIKDRLKKDSYLDKVGGIEYLSTLPDFVPITANYLKYIEIVKEKSILRSIIEVGTNMVKTAQTEEVPIEDILNLVEKDVYKLSMNNKKENYESIKKILIRTFDEIEERAKNKSGITGLPTGFELLDRKTAGLQKSNLIILAARPGMGKSSLALNIATNCAIRSKVPVLIFNMEMSKEDIAKRILSSEALISSKSITTGDLSSEDWERIGAVSQSISESEIIIDDTPGINIVEIRSKARKLKSELDIGLIIIDYLQLIEPIGRKNGTREQEISEISRALKKLAMELQIPIITLSQLSRSVEKNKQSKRPMLSDLRESGAIEQDADMVLFIYRDDYYNNDTNKNTAEIIIAKHRGGELGTIEVGWHGENTKFMNLTNRSEDE